MEQLILIGGGGHCKSCIDVIEQTGLYEIVGIVDKQNNVGTKVLGYEVIGTDKHLERFVNKGYSFLITIGQIRTSEIRHKLYNELKRLNATLVIVKSPRAYVSKYATVEEGTIIMHDALVNAGAYVGANCIINTKALIEHDAKIGAHCHISTAATINGGTEVKQGSFFGSNATSREYTNTLEGSFIKAGAIFSGENNE